jgi:uncharacterized protein (DUF427 family)
MSVETARGRVKVESCAKRIRVYAGGDLVADTISALLVWEVPYYPTYYLPAGDVRAALEPTGSTEHSPSRGDAEILDVRTPHTVVRASARRYPEPAIEALRGHVRFQWDAMDEWFEEDEPVYVHPRDPYTRVDILTSSRHVEVRVDGLTVAETHRPTLLFETGLPTRYYFPLTDARLDLLTPTTGITRCPYKGSATYWSLGDHVDLAWCYRTPLPESQKIAGLICFYNERVELVVDGVVQDRPPSRFG